MSEDGGNIVELGISPVATPWNEARPCLVCGGHPGIVKADQHCTGGMRQDDQVAYCTTRRSSTTDVEPPPWGTAHKIGGGCGCGTFHPRRPGSNGHQGELNGYHEGPDGLPAFTDTRNALRLVDRHGTTIRKDYTRGKKRALQGWRLWNGVRWALDETEVMLIRAKEIVEHLAEEIPLDTGLHAKTVKALRDDALACESTGRLNSMISNAGSLVPATHETWDPDPYLLNCQNGTVDLRTGELLEHHPDRYQSKLAPTAYDPEMPTPVWDAFLERIFAGDTNLVEFVQRAIGVSLVGKVVEHVLFVMYGSGANGKSTFINVWLDLLGDYARAASMDLLVEQKNPQHPTSVAELVGVRFISTGELRGGKFDEGLVKALTGGDARNARFMFEDAFVYVPSDTFWLATNHKPVITGNSEGIWRRIRLLPFEAQIPLEEQDRDLPAKLRAEYPGILAWAVRGTLAWLEQGLGHSRAVDAATAVYRGEMDTLATFLADRCVVEPDAWVASTELYKAYEGWCEETGERPAGTRFFGIRLGERGFQRQKLFRERRWHWLGLRLRTDDDLFDGDGPPPPPPPAGPTDANRADLFGPFDPSDEPVDNPDAIALNRHEAENPEIRRTLEPINPVTTRAGALRELNGGIDSTRARARGLTQNTGSWVHPSSAEPPSRLLSADAPIDAAVDGCDLALLEDAPPGGPDRCPDCSALMYHRAHQGHWDHDCQRCPARYRSS